MPSGSVSSEADVEHALPAHQATSVRSGPPGGLDELSERRQVAPGPLEQRAHVREIFGGIDGQANVRPPQRRRRGQLDDAEQVRIAAHVRRDVLAIVGLRRFPGRPDERLARDGFHRRAVRQPLLVNVVGLRDTERGEQTARRLDVGARVVCRSHAQCDRTRRRRPPPRIARAHRRRRRGTPMHPAGGRRRRAPDPQGDRSWRGPRAQHPQTSAGAGSARGSSGPRSSASALRGRRDDPSRACRMMPARGSASARPLQCAGALRTREDAGSTRPGRTRSRSSSSRCLP